MAAKHNATLLKNNFQNSGFASIEMIPILIVVVGLLSFSFGFFSVIQRATLSSISSLNSSISTMTNRANVTHFNSNPANNVEDLYPLRYRLVYIRKSGASVLGPQKDSPDISLIREPSSQGFSNPSLNTSADFHNQELEAHDHLNDQTRGIKGVNPVWIKTALGICLRADCGL